MIISRGQMIAPQALGELTPTLSNGYYYADQGLNLLNQYAAYSALYKAQPSIATVVDKISNSAARLSVKVWDPTPETGQIEDKSSAFAKLIRNPSPVMSTFNFYRWTFATAEVYGEAFWFKQRDASGVVVGLIPMHPSRTAIRREEDGTITYIFTLGVGSAGILYAPADDVVPFQRYNPDNIMRGMSRMEPLRSTLLNEDAARRANQSFWKRGARPSVVLQHPGELSQAAQDRIKASFDARHAGADNMGGTSILEEGMTANVMQLNLEEMQYIESRKLNLQEVCMVYDVPPPVVHILDHATYSNITEQMRSMYRDTMTPRLEDVESVIDFALRPEFFAAGERVARFDMSEVLRGDFEGRSTAVIGLRNAGLATGNQGLEIMGFPKSEDPEMDKFYANAALVPLGSPLQRVTVTEPIQPTPDAVAEAQDAIAGSTSEAAAASTPATAPASDEAKALRRDVMGVLGRLKAFSVKDVRAALVGVHQRKLDAFFQDQRGTALAVGTKKDLSGFNPADWDQKLENLLYNLSVATADEIGRKIASDLGGQYDASEISGLLLANATRSAENINQATKDQIERALESNASDPTSETITNLFAGPIASRSQQIATTRVAVVAGIATLAAARQSGAATKTWVTGSKARSLHAAMDGETVPLGQKFSNGMDGPGDYSGGAEEVANCNCELSFSKGR